MKRENAIAFVHIHDENYLSYDSLKYIMFFGFWFFTILVGVFVVISDNVPCIVLLAMINLLYLGLIISLRFKLIRNTFSLRFMTNGIAYLLSSTFWLIVAYSMLMLVGYDNDIAAILYGTLALYIVVISTYLSSVIVMLCRLDKLKISRDIYVMNKIAIVCILGIAIMLMPFFMYCLRETDNQVAIYVMFCPFFLLALLFGCGLSNFIKYYFCVKYDIKSGTRGDTESFLLIPASGFKK